MSFYSTIGTILPESLLKKTGKMLLYAGIKEDAETYVGRILFLMLLLFIIPPLLKLVLDIYGFYSLNNNAILILEFLILILTPFGFYAHLSFLISSRAERAEEVFPDFLYDIGANLNSGMPIFQAFLTSSLKKEFGVLSEEAKEIYEKHQSDNLNKLFDELTWRFDSRHIENFVKFFERSIVLGGSISALLQSYAEEMRTILNMKKEMKERTFTYVVFISIIAVFIFPFLLAIAYTYISLMTSFYSNIKLQQNIGIGAFMLNKIAITREDITVLSIAFIFLSGLLTSLLIALLRKGKLIFFLKYVFLIWLITYTIFYLSINVLAKFLSLKI